MPTRSSGATFTNCNRETPGFRQTFARLAQAEQIQPAGRGIGPRVLKADLAELGAGAGDAAGVRIERDFETHHGAGKTTEEAHPVGFSASTARNAFALGQTPKETPTSCGFAPSMVFSQSSKKGPERSDPMIAEEPNPRPGLHKTCAIFRFKLDQGAQAGITFNATLSACDNPCCPCTHLTFECIPMTRPEGRSISPSTYALASSNTATDPPPRMRRLVKRSLPRRGRLSGNGFGSASSLLNASRWKR